MSLINSEQREKLLDYNEELCRQYNESEDEQVLRKIAATELILIYTAPISNARLEIEEETL